LPRGVVFFGKFNGLTAVDPALIDAGTNLRSGLEIEK
jgi:hypothetical protein